MRLPLLTTVLLGSALGWMCRADNAVYLPSAGEIPDLTQTDRQGRFAGGGRSFCGPVAVSNSLMALFREDLEARKMSHYDLVHELASDRCMNTHVEKGTSVQALLRGVELFLEDRGERDYYLKFQGWRRHDLRHRTGVTEPRLEWIRKVLAEGGAVWLNIGWYERTDEEGVYKRLGGHWVTAVGFGQDEEGRPSSKHLVIHDPAPRAGMQPSREFVEMAPLESGTITGVMRNLPHPARNLYRMQGGMHVKRGADLAILDGAAALRLAPRQERR